MDEIKLSYFLFIAFWILLTAAILIFGKRWHRLRAFRACMLAQWKPALAISGLFLLGSLLGSRMLNPYTLAIFCEALIGLALARGSLTREPLPVTQAITQKNHPVRAILLMVLFSVLAAVAAVIIGSVGMSIAQQVFHETSRSQEAMNSIAPSAWQAFWQFLSGAGIAEETLFRLVVLSALWRLTRRPWLAVVISALLFGGYHLTPLNGMYRIFLQFPVSQFVGSVFIGLVWGWLFVRRGYETGVLAHTLSNWLPLLIFTQ